MHGVDENNQMYILEILWKKKEPTQLWTALPEEIIQSIFQQTCSAFVPYNGRQSIVYIPDNIPITIKDTPKSEKVDKYATDEEFVEYCQSRETMVDSLNMTENTLYSLSTKVLRKPPAAVMDKMLLEFEQGRRKPLSPKYEEYPLFDAAAYYMQNLKPELSITWITL